jgi:hypothetical protein
MMLASDRLPDVAMRNPRRAGWMQQRFGGGAGHQIGNADVNVREDASGTGARFTEGRP